MLALREALRLAGSREATIYTDSEWALNICTGRWKASVYEELWKEIKAMRADCHQITWVKAHDKNKYNEEVDKLAKKAV
jgi:ribonuclease HI